MNVLLATISAFSYNTEVRPYKVNVDNCSVESIEAKHTNESVLKCVVKLNDVIRTGGLNKVIALASNKTLNEKNSKSDDNTAIEFYREEFKKVTPSDSSFVVIRIENEDGTARNISTIINEVCREIETDDNVYIDSAGGLRTMSNLIQLLTVLLKYIGIKNPGTLYSDIQNAQAFISDTKQFVQMTDLADAFNEFMNTGKADQLQKCCGNKEMHPSVLSLLNTMNEFSDKIRLGNVDSIDAVVGELQKHINECNQIVDYNTIEIAIIKQFLPIIREKLLGGESQSVDYVQLIRWCLDNSLIQQALTLFVEKIPLMLYEKKIFEYKGNLRLKKEEWLKLKGGVKHCEWECDAFYTDLLTIKDSSDLLVDELKQAIKSGTKSKDSRINDVVQIIRSFNNPELKSDKVGKIASAISNDVARSGYTSYGKMINAICDKSKENLLKDLLGIDIKREKSSKDQTLKNKFSAMRQINEFGFHNKGYRLNLSKGLFTNLMYGYIYIKATRNQINHASSEENMDDEQKAILSEIGYDFNNDSLKTIKKNIGIALEAVIAAIDSQKKVIEEVVPETFEPTTLKINDVVDSVYIGDKIVRIEPNNYDIQLVVPRYEPFEAFDGETIKVCIKQISKDGKIKQVTLCK